MSLHISGRTRDFEALYALYGLKSLGLNGHSMTDLSPLLPFTQLQSIYLGFCKALDFALIERFTGLQGLHLTKIAQLRSLAGLERASRLMRIELVWLPHIEILPDLSALECLEEVEIEKMAKLTSIDAIIAAPKLRYLALWGCPSLTPESFRCAQKHKTLSRISFDIGSKGANAAVAPMFSKEMQQTVFWKFSKDSPLRRPTL